MLVRVCRVTAWIIDKVLGSLQHMELTTQHCTIVYIFIYSYNNYKMIKTALLPCMIPFFRSFSFLSTIPYILLSSAYSDTFLYLVLTVRNSQCIKRCCWQECHGGNGGELCLFANCLYDDWARPVVPNVWGAPPQEILKGGARGVWRKNRTEFGFSNFQWTLFAIYLSPSSFYEFHHTMNLF
jgi:hypothetical protein